MHTIMYGDTKTAEDRLEEELTFEDKCYRLVEISLVTVLIVAVWTLFQIIGTVEFLVEINAL